MLEYGTVKAVISVKVNGEFVSEFTTFQGTIVESILRSAQCSHVIEDGDEFDVKIEMKSISKEASEE